MICTLCKIHEAVHNKKKCQSCLNKLAVNQLNYVNKRKANSLCVDCGQPITKHTYCDICRARRQEKARLRYAKNRQANTCSHCGSQTTQGKRLCDRCLDIHKKIRDKREMNSPRQKAKERDHFQCQICGKTTRLQVHHIDEMGEREFNSHTRRKASDVNNSLNNLVTLCRHCHNSVTLFLHNNTEIAILILQRLKWD